MEGTYVYIIIQLYVQAKRENVIVSFMNLMVSITWPSVLKFKIMGINQSEDVLNHRKIFRACERSISIDVLHALNFTNSKICINKIYYNEWKRKTKKTCHPYFISCCRYIYIYIWNKGKSELKNRKWSYVRYNSISSPYICNIFFHPSKLYESNF